MQFIYYIPKAPAAPAELLERLGLAAVLGCPVEAGAMEDGPDGGGGCVLWASDGPRAKLPARELAAGSTEKDRMRWIPIRGDKPEAPEEGEPPVLYYLGYDRQDPPRPEELLRATALPGEKIVLGDGNDWLIPHARRYDADEGFFVAAVPIRETLGDDGGVTTDVVDAHRALWDAAAEVWNQCRLAHHKAASGRDDYQPPEGYEPPELMSDERAGEIFELALASNHRLGRWEIAALGLLRSDALLPVLRAIADVDAFEEMAKNLPEPGGD